MVHFPDHTPAAAAVEHASLIAALDAGDLAGIERDRAATLVETCTGCASLQADLALIRAATATLPGTPRTRDYRLTDADAARFRPSAWGRLVGWLGAPRSTVRPLAGGLAALGIAGLLLSTTPGFLGGAATSLSTTAAPVTAPGEASTASGGAEDNARLGTASSPAGAPSSVASVTPGAPGVTPKFAALPAPSLAAVALPASSPAVGAVPAPTTIPSESVPARPEAAPIPGASGLPTDAGPIDSAPGVGPAQASQREVSAAFTSASELASPDRTLPLVLSLVLLAAGIGLFVANRVLRHRAGV